MRCLITVTFDLQKAESSLYPKITKDLEDIYFVKSIHNERKVYPPIEIQKAKKNLPKNTYLAEYTDDDISLKDLDKYIDSIAQDIKKIFESYSVHGKYFISIGTIYKYKLDSF